MEMIEAISDTCHSWQIQNWGTRRGICNGLYEPELIHAESVLDFDAAGVLLKPDCRAKPHDPGPVLLPGVQRTRYVQHGKGSYTGGNTF